MHRSGRSAHDTTVTEESNASYSRMFAAFGWESFGWLLMGKAGQAAPCGPCPGHGPSGDGRVTLAGEGVDDVGEELATQDLLAEAVLAPGRSLQLVEVPGTSLHGVDDQLITVVIDEDDQFQEVTCRVDRDHQPATRVVLVVKGDVNSAHGRPRSERRHRRDGRIGSACGRRNESFSLGVGVEG